LVNTGNFFSLHFFAPGAGDLLHLGAGDLLVLGPRHPGHSRLRRLRHKACELRLQSVHPPHAARRQPAQLLEVLLSQSAVALTRALAGQVRLHFLRKLIGLELVERSVRGADVECGEGRHLLHELGVESGLPGASHLREEVVAGHHEGAQDVRVHAMSATAVRLLLQLLQQVPVLLALRLILQLLLRCAAHAAQNLNLNLNQ